MEIMAELGVGGRIWEEGDTTALSSRVVWVESMAGREYGVLPIMGAAQDARGPLSRFRSVNIAQTHMEAILHDRLVELGGSVRFGHRVTDARDTGGGRGHGGHPAGPRGSSLRLASGLRWRRQYGAAQHRHRDGRPASADGGFAGSTLAAVRPDAITLFAQDPAWEDVARDAAERSGFPVAVVRFGTEFGPQAADLLGLAPGGAVAVRPDGHVLWRDRDGTGKAGLVAALRLCTAGQPVPA